MINVPFQFPLFVTWNLTSKCNLRCRHCFRVEYEKEQYDKNMIDDLIKLFSEHNVVSVSLTGGEPLLSSYINQIVKSSKRKFKIVIATNGTCIDLGQIKEFKSYGVTDYQISIEGTTAEINDYIRGEGTYKKIINTITLLKREGCHITLAMTANKFNQCDIRNNALVFADKHNIDRLRIECFLPIGNAKNYGEIMPLSFEERINLFSELKKIKSNAELMIPSFDKKYHCGAGVYNLVLNSDLTISPCDMLTHKIHSSPITKASDILDFWINSDIFNEWRKHLYYNSSNIDEYSCVAELYNK